MGESGGATKESFKLAVEVGLAAGTPFALGWHGASPNQAAPEQSAGERALKGTLYPPKGYVKDSSACVPMWK